jgi:magnesium chelatase subunit D
MTGRDAPGSSRWGDATLAASLFAIDPTGMGVVLRARVGSARDRWLAFLFALLPQDTPSRRLPSHVSEGRLLGGLDLAATLRAGRPVAERGILVEADGGIVVIAMAERLTLRTASTLATVLEEGVVVMERDGMALRSQARVGMVALDEGIEADERPPAGLLDRFAFLIDLGGIADRDIDDPPIACGDILAARSRLPTVQLRDEVVEALCAAGLALGIASVRAVLLALRVARSAAAFAGRDMVSDDDAALAARLVLAPRATRLPAVESNAEEEAESEPDPTESPGDAPGEQDGGDEERGGNDQPLSDMVLEAAQAAIPSDLLARLGAIGAGGGARGGSGRAGAPLASMLRGRPIGVRRGQLGRGARLNLIETLRAAAPWQRLRRTDHGPDGDSGPRISVRRDDFRITRFKARTETTIIFLVDASGSSALNRLAEAKGAVELVLAECYVRRDQVALIVFRGKGAEILLPPTTSLARAKRSLAGVPGGGGTPIAAGIDCAILLADGESRKGRTPIVILMTDGKANIARDGQADRPRAEEEALIAARTLRAAGLDCLLVDTAPRPERLAKNLAAEMSGRYLALPYADAASISHAVQAVATPVARAG